MASSVRTGICNYVYLYMKYCDELVTQCSSDGRVSSDTPRTTAAEAAEVAVGSSQPASHRTRDTHDEVAEDGDEVK